MNLNPDSYSCPDDQTDLTERVKDVVSGKFDYVYRSGPLTRAKPDGPNKFEVVVTCPGGAGGKPHLCTCAGTYTL